MNTTVLAEQVIEASEQTSATPQVLLELSDLEITLVGGGTGAVIFP